MEQSRRLSSLDSGFILLERVEQEIAEASGPPCEAGPGLSSSEMPLGPQQLPPLWDLPGAEPRRRRGSPSSYAHPTPTELKGSSRGRVHTEVLQGCPRQSWPKPLCTSLSICQP